MRTGAATWVLFIMLVNVPIFHGTVWADNAGSTTEGVNVSRATVKVHDINELQDISNDLTVAYELANDIDASSTKDWNSGSGFTPIGRATDPFIGSLEGNGYNITGLYINRNIDNVGLFGFIGNAGWTKNINLIDCLVSGYGYVGGLAGTNEGTIHNVSATGGVNANNGGGGGLVGYNNWATVSDSYARVNITGTVWLGGLVGCNNYGTVNNSYAEGYVISGSWYYGGLVGVNYGTVVNSHASGNVSGDCYLGGLVGHNIRGTITNSHATGNLYGTDSIGGLVGWSEQGKVTGCYGTGNITSGRDYIGGLMGVNTGTVDNSHASGNVLRGQYVGGLIGHNSGIVNNTYATGDVRGSKDYVGGLVGYNRNGRVSLSYSSGNVSGPNSVGGLMGCNNGGIVENTYSTAKVSGTRGSNAGLVGWNSFGIVNNSYAAGSVTGSAPVGGLVGYSEPGAVNRCFWDNESTGQGSSAGGTGKTTKAMKTRATFTTAGWDFAGIWCMAENTTYPLLRCRDLEAPRANAGVDQSVKEDGPMTFDGSGSSDDLAIANYTWSFTDGGPVAVYGVRPEYRFDTPGVFTVKLKVVDLLDKTAEDDMTVTVHDITPPKPDAGGDRSVDEDVPVTLDGGNSTDNVGIVNYTWTFTDRVPVVLSGAQSTYNFENPGVIAVTLKATDAAGNRGFVTINITVNDITAPVADAGPDQIVDEGTVVMFEGGGTDNVGIMTFTWTFTDAVEVRLEGNRITYQFDNPGVFVVTLNLTDAAGNWGIDTMTVMVNDITAPVADAGPDQVIIEGANVTFDASGSRDNGGIASCNWSFEDGRLVTLDDMWPTYRFNNPGLFVVTLKVTDFGGNWDTDTLTVTVKDVTAPVAFAGPDLKVDEGTLMTFNGSGSSDNVGVVNYTWMFQYGTKEMTLFGISPSFSFRIPGVYSVRLNVTDAAGNRHEDAMILTVNDITSPVTSAGQDRTVPAGMTIMLNGSLSTDNVGVAKWYWNFTYDGRMQNLEGVAVSFTFETGGVYEVILTAVDLSDNRGFDTVVITVVDKGKVIGTVVDGDNKPVSGATVEITAADGGKQTVETGTNGAFVLTVHHGNFTWKVTKKGYRPITGTSSVKPMGEVRLELTRTPLVEVTSGGISGLPLMTLILAVVVIVAVAGIGGYAVMRRKSRGIDRKPSSVNEPVKNAPEEVSDKTSEE